MGATVTLPLINGRRVDIYIPAGLAANAKWVISPHPGGSDSVAWPISCGLNAAADSGLFYVVYPNGLGISQTWYCGNNGDFLCCGYAESILSPDVEFIKLLIEYIPTLYSINRSKLVFASHSNGGMLSTSVRAAYPNSVAGMVLVSCAYIGVWQEIASGASCPVTYIYGTADTIIPPNGGVSTLTNPFNSNLPYHFPNLDIWQQALKIGGAVFTNRSLAGIGHLPFSTINAALAPDSFASLTAAMVASI